MPPQPRATLAQAAWRPVPDGLCLAPCGQAADVGRGVARIARGGEIEKSCAWGRQTSIGGGGVERGELHGGRV